MTKDELRFVNEVSKRIWAKCRADNKGNLSQAYESYEFLMKKFYSGNRMIFKLSDKDTVSKSLGELYGQNTSSKRRVEELHSSKGRQIPEMRYNEYVSYEGSDEGKVSSLIFNIRCHNSPYGHSKKANGTYEVDCRNA